MIDGWGEVVSFVRFKVVFLILFLRFFVVGRGFCLLLV